jgi:hypothetical protein
LSSLYRRYILRGYLELPLRGQPLLVMSQATQGEPQTSLRGAMTREDSRMAKTLKIHKLTSRPPEVIFQNIHRRESTEANEISNTSETTPRCLQHVVSDCPSPILHMTLYAPLLSPHYRSTTDHLTDDIQPAPKPPQSKTTLSRRPRQPRKPSPRAAKPPRTESLARMS